MMLTMNEGQPASDFLDVWQTLLDDALLSGLVIDPSLQPMLLLAVLPPSWRAFVTTQPTVVNLIVQLLSTKILQEEVMRGNVSTSHIPTAMATTFKPNRMWNNQGRS